MFDFSNGGFQQLEQQGVEVNVSADATELQATIDGEDGKNLIEYLDGDAEQLHIKIFDEDGRQLTEIVDGNIDKLKTLIDSQNGRMITVNVSGKKLFAEGGRAAGGRGGPDGVPAPDARPAGRSRGGTFL